MRAESAVEPTKSANITVTCRRSAVSWAFGSALATCSVVGGVAPLSSPMAASILRRCPTGTPMSLRSSSVRWRNTETSILFSANHWTYSDMPRFLSQSAICCIGGPRRM